MAIKQEVSFRLDGASYEGCAAGLDASLRAALDAALEGKELSEQQALAVAEARGEDLVAVAAVADQFRKKKAGDEVSYVVNRNINFTNICIVGCTFCCFGKSVHSPDAYWHSLEVVGDRAEEAWRRLKS